MPSFTTYEVEYTNIKPWNNTNLGSGKMAVSVLDGGNASVKLKLKKAIEKKINSLGVRIDSYAEVAST